MSDLVQNLSEDLRSFIELEVGTGRFTSTHEVIETALRMLKERESRLAVLRAAMAETDHARANPRRGMPDGRPPGA